MSSTPNDSISDDVKDMKTWQFVFVSEMCRTMSIIDTLNILRNCNWDANVAVNCALHSVESSKHGSIKKYSEVKQIEISLDYITPCYFDYSVRLLSMSHVPLGISLCKSDTFSISSSSLYSAINFASERVEVSGGSNDDMANVDTGVILIDDILQQPRSLAFFGGLKVKDILLRLNESIFSLCGGNASVDDIYDKINAIRNKNLPVTLKFRRVLRCGEYAVLPSISAKLKPYLGPFCGCFYPTGCIPSPKNSLGQATQRSDPLSICDGDTTPSNAVDDILTHAHPLPCLLYCQHLFDETKAIQLHTLLLAMKEQQMCQWKSLLDSVYDQGFAGSGSVGDDDCEMSAKRNDFCEASLDLDCVQSASAESSSHSTSDFVASNLVLEESCEGHRLDHTSYMTSVLKHKLVSKTELILGIKASFDAGTRGPTSLVEVVKPFLRPAYTVRILSVEKSSKYGNNKTPDKGFMMAGMPSTSIFHYVTWVFDVRKGSDWIIRRTFDEFVEFRDSVIEARADLRGLEFPVKRIFQVVANTDIVIKQRMNQLDGFLRSVVRLATTVNADFLSTIKLRLLLDKFLGMQSRYIATFVAEAKLSAHHCRLMLRSREQDSDTVPTPDLAPTLTSSLVDVSPVEVLRGVIERFLRVYIHLVVVQDGVTELNKVHTCCYLQPLMLSIDQYSLRKGGWGKSDAAGGNFGSESESDYGMKESPLSDRLSGITTFLDNMTAFLYDCLISDCYDIVTHCGQYHATTASVSTNIGSDQSYKDLFVLRPLRGGRVVKFSSLDKGTVREHIVNAFVVDRDASRLLRHNCPEVLGGDKASSGSVPFCINFDTGRKCSLGLSVSYEKLESFVRSAIRRQLEYEVLTPMVLSKVREHLKTFYASTEDKLSTKIAELRHRPQSYFGIDEVVQSHSQWYDVIKSLRDVWSCSLPCYRIGAYLETIKRISAVCNIERSVHHTEREVEGQTERKMSRVAIGADDFLPILIYVIVHSKPVHLLALNSEFQLFCGRDSLISETGYYLTAFNAAVLHLLNFDLDDESMV